MQPETQRPVAASLPSHAAAHCRVLIADPARRLELGACSWPPAWCRLWPEQMVVGIVRSLGPGERRRYQLAAVCSLGRGWGLRLRGRFRFRGLMPLHFVWVWCFGPRIQGPGGWGRRSPQRAIGAPPRRQDRRAEPLHRGGHGAGPGQVPHRPGSGRPRQSVQGREKSGVLATPRAVWGA